MSSAPNWQQGKKIIANEDLLSRHHDADDETFK